MSVILPPLPHHVCFSWLIEKQHLLIIKMLPERLTQAVIEVLLKKEDPNLIHLYEQQISEQEIGEWVRSGQPLVAHPFCVGIIPCKKP